MKKTIFIILIILTITSCNDMYNKGKKGDFLFRKCSKCGLEKEKNDNSN